MYVASLSYPTHDSDEYPAAVYLPGSPVPLAGTERCVVCDEPLTVAGALDRRTGGPQDPAAGQHDGVVIAFYAGDAHLRCLLDGEARVDIDSTADPRPTETAARAAAEVARATNAAEEAKARARAARAAVAEAEAALGAARAAAQLAAEEHQEAEAARTRAAAAAAAAYEAELARREKDAR